MNPARFPAIIAGALLLVITVTSRAFSVPAESPARTVARVCGHCHALEIKARCLAGGCRGNNVVRLANPPPWDFVVDWMKTMGAAMTDAERQTILDYLGRSYPPKPYPLNWIKVPAATGEGGWNVVSMREHEGVLYAGFEGNGKIFRSTDGSVWNEAADTGHYTVYGIVPFKGALYAGTNDPDPQIWKSIDGKTWGLERSLPAQDHGVISLGEFKGFLYAGTARARIYRSSDGRLWNEGFSLADIPRSDYSHWVRFLIEFHGNLYTGIERGALYQSPDGVTWNIVGRNVTMKTGVRGSAVFKDALYVGNTGGGEIWKTLDGLSWEPVFKAPPYVKRGYVASLTVAGEMLYAGIDGFVFRTSDGKVWEEVGHLSPFTIEAMEIFKGSLYAGTLLPRSGQLYRTKIVVNPAGN